MIKTYKYIFIAAGIYNLAFGTWLFISPESLFDFFGLPLLMPLILYKTLAVIIAAFSSLYFYSAFHLQSSKKLIVLGLLSKIAPILFMTMVQFYLGFDWKWYLLIFFNDVIWWTPFLIYLRSFKKS